MKLLADEELERSGTVANSSMNRERGLTGPNSYEKELGFNPLRFLRERSTAVKRATAGQRAAWLDLCCGNGRALCEAALELTSQGEPQQFELLGVDLVATWPRLPPELSCVAYQAASLHSWRPTRKFDLITCVHGLHYVGDKLGLIERAMEWLSSGGRFVAHLDLANLSLADGTSMNRRLRATFRKFALPYDPRRRLLAVDGPRAIDFGYRYLGADDEAGANATGQRAVNSYYDRCEG
ncbi:MAG TPA: methyltransferase domain-containing protein [Pirellulales bacterium]|nr:methyltransferase domain-containing protein [Pirellulales bacterium]